MSSNPEKRFGIIDSFTMAGNRSGALTGLSFVAKDLIDIQGKTTGAGNPRWKETHRPALKNAQIIDLILSEGAILKGKAATDEFALSLDGLNNHYPGPENPNYPERIPGGSSSGSATAVASSLVDFALGTDTVGSIRVPAAYCGIYGFRPSHGAISLEGVLPLGPSFDTLGLMSKSPEILAALANFLFKKSEKIKALDRLIVPVNLFNLVDKNFEQPVFEQVERLKKLFTRYETINLDLKIIDIWCLAFSVIRSYEAWSYFGTWMEKNSCHVSPQIYARFLEGKAISKHEYEHALNIKYGAVELMGSILKNDGILCLPTAWNLPPLRNSSPEVLAENRKQNIRLNVIAVMASLPQLAVPSFEDGLSLSFTGPSGSDRELLNRIERLPFDNFFSSH